LSALVLLLLAELLFFSIRFDPFSYSNILGGASLVIKLGISLIVALLIFGGERVKATIADLARQLDARPFPWFELVGHVATLAAFYQLTIIVFEGDGPSRTSPMLWLAAWGAVGLVALMFWIGATFPTALWSTARVPSVRVFTIGSLVALAALWAGQLAERLWQLLAVGTFWVVQWILSLFYSAVLVQPSDLILGTESFSVQIAPMCSGHEGIGLIIVFVGAFLWWFRRDLKFPQAFLLLLVGVLAIWFANAFRIAALIAIGSSISRTVALGGFHSQAGWLAFNLVALGVIAVAWRSPVFAKNVTRRRSAATGTGNPAAPYLVPFLVLVATAMLTGALSSGTFDHLYAVRVAATALALGCFFHAYRRLGILRWSWSWPAVAIGAAVFVIWTLLEPLSPVDDAARTAYADSIASLSPVMVALWITFRAVGSVLIVPIVEELAFRGYLTRRLIAEEFDSVPMGQFSWFAFLVSSVIFGLLHGRWLAGTLAGMLFAWALYRRGRLTDAVLAHATANGLITIYVLNTQNWAAWS
jgi:exosortase E/protease (VPEID-CTERM system)